MIEQGIRHHPDRVEVVMFSAEDIDRGRLAAKRQIIRPLGLLEIDPGGGFKVGRMVHLLTPSKERLN